MLAYGAGWIVDNSYMAEYRIGEESRIDKVTEKQAKEIARRTRDLQFSPADRPNANSGVTLCTPAASVPGIFSAPQLKPSRTGATTGQAAARPRDGRNHRERLRGVE